MSTTSSGCLVVVVGPSGVGKDSLLNAARSHFQSNARVQFVTRVITRDCDPAAEIHDTLSEAEFSERQRQGGFAITWRANDLYYGLPAHILADIENAQLVIANGSRAAIPAFRERFKQLVVVSVRASTESLATRLRNRNRESEQAIQKRLERNDLLEPLTGKDVVNIDNSGPREVAIAEFIALLESKLTTSA